ncbi:hypothetical protein J2Z83_002801 [Virgibacillus natechei]|uniref:Uncharacterized protein n=1 Tax=Virgibacillus natechei TaxID=1216297 RepID=A0ABS4IIB7_9BACI|nr:hypothetical protein [Virgibacillus natechei]
MIVMCGLLERDIEFFYRALVQFTEIEKTIIFGSRAN